MPTYAELIEESVWRAEVVPEALHGVSMALRDYYDLAPSAIGIRGDNKHLSGYHRSRDWLLRSRWSKGANYSVRDSTLNAIGGGGNWVCAIDITVTRSKLLPMCRSLDVAVRAGRLSMVAEWYGNTNGDSRVDGYNALLKRVATSDSKHLWHLHISFIRSRANGNMTELIKVLTTEASTLPNGSGNPPKPQDQEWTEKMLRNAPELSSGDGGTWVLTAQGLLCARGHAVKVDGDMGPKTVSATKAMQKRYGAEAVDGIWGPETWTIAFTGQDLA